MVFKASPKAGVVSLAFSSDFNKLELVWLNPQSGQIINAGFIEIQGIDITSRSILQPDALTDAIESLFSELDVPKTLPVCVMLPSYYTRLITLPPGLSENDLRNLLVSEAERSVVFKDKEPAIDWIFLDIEDEENQFCIYTAYPQEALKELFEVFNRLKLNVAAVESNITAIMKGLITTGTLQQDDQRRLIAILNEGNFTTVALNGLEIVSVVEVPVSLQNVQADELVNDIQQDVNGLGDILEDCHEVILVHNNSNVPTEQLANSFSRFDEVILVEQAVYTIASLGAQEPLYPCTVEALGVAMHHELTHLPTLNLLPKEMQIKVMVNDLRKQIMPFAVAANVLMVALVGLVYGIMLIGNLGKGAEVDRLQQQLASIEGPSIPPEMYAESLWLHRYSTYNESALKWLLSLHQHMPGNIWLQELAFSHDKGKTLIALEGGTTQGNEIADYLKKIQPEFIKTTVESAKVEPQLMDLDTKLASNANGSGGQQAQQPGETAIVTNDRQYYAWEANTPSEDANTPNASTSG